MTLKKPPTQKSQAKKRARQSTFYMKERFYPRTFKKVGGLNITIDLIRIESTEETNTQCNFKGQLDNATKVVMKTGTEHILAVPKKVIDAWWKKEANGFLSGTSRIPVREPLDEDEESDL